MNVIKFRPLNKYQKGFFTCPNCLDDTDTHILCDMNNGKPFITGFVCAGSNCPDKGTYYPVQNGHIGEGEEK